MWAHSLRVQSAVWEGMVGDRTLLGHSVHSQEAEGEMNAGAQGPTPWDGFCPYWLHLPSSVIPLWNHLHRHAPRPLSQVTLDPIKLIVLSSIPYDWASGVSDFLQILSYEC